jgi:hypothetical protein
MYDYYLGGKDNLAADRAAADLVLDRAPEVREIAVANRAFLVRVVRYLAGELGITQFLDVGTGIPTAPNVHEVARAARAGARVVYADNDPVVLARARALLAGTGDTVIIDADLRDPAGIIEQAAATLDLARPAALLLVAVLHFIPGADDPAGIVRTLSAALAPGSYVAVSHGTTDFHPAEVTSAAARAYEAATGPLVLRPREEITAILGGLELEPPGLVQAPLWRPDGQPPEPGSIRDIGIYGALGRTAPAS